MTISTELTVFEISSLTIQSEVHAIRFFYSMIATLMKLRDVGAKNNGSTVLLIVLCILLSSCLSKNKKHSSFGGYASGSITDYHLEGFVDSTFRLTNTIDIKGTWKMDKDTIYLLVDDLQCAKISMDKNVSVSCHELNILKQMEIKIFDPPTILKFPNQD